MRTEAPSRSRGAALARAAFPVVMLALAAAISAKARASFPRDAGGPAEAARARLVRAASARPALAFGFRHVLGDLAWLKAIQVGAPEGMTPEERAVFADLIAAVNNYDPVFDVPYIFAAIRLGDAADGAPDALKILATGISARPRDWRLPFYAGYIHYFALGDPAAGGRALEAAARIPGSPPYLTLLAARMLAEGREPDTALAFLDELLRGERDPGRREALERRRREVVVERDIQAMERAAKAFGARTGRAPSGLPELVAAGDLAAVPPEPHGGRYAMGPGGEITSDRVAGRLTVFRK